MNKHSKKVRSYALKSLIVLAVLMMILSVVPSEVLWDNILLSASPTRNRNNIGQVSEVTEPLDIMTNPSKIILSFLS